MLDHGHPRVLGDEADEPLASARDDEIDEPRQARAGRASLRDRRGDDLDRVGGEPGLGERLRAAARPSAALERAASEPPRKQHRVAALDAQRRGVDGDVGARLVDDGDDAERDAHLADQAGRWGGGSCR